MSSPKITYALLCYQQENFVRDAARSALLQDCAPLDIILSDDCSCDGTFEILKEEAAAYNGVHSVRLNRNAENLGIEHNNKVAELAAGDLVILAHGDDIAVAQRARRVAEVWQETSATVLSSNAWVIDAESRPLGMLSGEAKSRFLSIEELLGLGWQKTMLGASLAFERRVFSEFGWLDRRRTPVGTDHIFPFRGALMSGMYYIAEPLLYWRQHAMNMGDLVGDKSGAELVFRETYLGYRVARALGMLHDLGELVRRRGRQPELVAIEQELGVRIQNVIRAWITMRNDLYLEGLRPTWVEKRELEKRTIKKDYRVWPDVTAVEVPPPPRAGLGERKAN